MIERTEVRLDVGLLEVVRRPLPLGALEEISVASPRIVRQIVDVVDVLQVHGNTFEPVGELTTDWAAIEAAHLLKIGKLADLESVEPDLPPKTPSAKRRALPVVFDESNVVLARPGPQRLQRFEILFLNVDGVRLENHLKLVKLLEAIGIVAITSVGGSPGRLDVGDVPRFRTERTQEGGGVVRPCANF